MEPAQEDRGLAVRLGATACLLFLLLGQAEITILDGSSMLAVAQSVVHDGSLAVPAEVGVEGEDGRHYSKYGLFLPLLSVLPVALVQPIGLVTGRLGDLEAAAAATLMPLVAGALVAALFLLARRLGAPRPAAALVAGGAVFGTYLLPYGRDFFSEPIVALGLVVMLERALAGRELHAGAALALAICARPQAAAFAPLLWAFLLLRGGGSAGVLRTLPPLAVAAAATVAYNLARFDDPLEFGYKDPADPGFTTPFFEGASGLLFSPEKSLFLFAPAVVLVPFALTWLWRRERVTAGVVGAVFAVTFALAATWHSWMGGWSWGPRLLVPAIPLLLVTLAPWIDRNARRTRAALALFAAGFAISFAAVLAPVGAQLLDRDPDADGPKIVRQVTELPELARSSVDAVDEPDSYDDDYRRHLAVWQATVVRELGWGGVPLAAVGTAVLAVALVRVGRPLLRGLS
ncbi:MAG TPA: hypothetical protein VD790_09295 [Thermoleophilaceae bacterium]|nr:hypothetical protein [Thermoleophilaceae bacterium]